jgi:hypothetical protein
MLRLKLLGIDYALVKLRNCLDIDSLEAASRGVEQGADFISGLVQEPGMQDPVKGACTVSQAHRSSLEVVLLCQHTRGDRFYPAITGVYAHAQVDDCGHVWIVPFKETSAHLGQVGFKVGRVARASANWLARLR